MGLFDVFSDPVNAILTISNPSMGLPIALGRQNEVESARGQREAGAVANRVGAGKQQIADIQSRQFQLADEMKKRMPKYKGLLQDKASIDLRQKLASDINQNKISASRRGLLGSGIEQMGKARALNQYAQDRAAKLSDIDRQVEDMALGIQDAPLMTGLEAAGLQGSDQANYYRQALSSMQARNSALSGILGGLGSVGGAYLGSRS